MKKKLMLLATIVLICAMCSVTVLAATEGGDAGNMFIGTFWSLVPPLVAIVLALITKEVYSSLFVGILVGSLLYNEFNIVGTVDSLVQEGLIGSVAGTAGIFVFLVVLGVLVALINKTGGSAAFGRWAQTHIKSKTGSILCTFALGVLISSMTTSTA